ncbi:MAG: universal stress protein [Flavobacteriaceae bacterium]
MYKILVPVDFSKKSEFAVKMSAQIGKKIKSEIHLLHLVELPSGIVDMGAGSNFSIPASMMYLRKVKEKIIHLKNTFFDSDHIIKYSIKFENPFEGIRNYTQKNDINLIVMGSKGVSDFEEMIIGSNTEKVVRTSNIPVVVVKTDNDKFKFKKLVFASNFDDENKAAFVDFLAFAKKFNSQIHLLKINTISNFESSYTTHKKIKDFVKGFNLKKKTISIYNDASVVKGIINFGKEIDADVIALTTHGRSGLSSLFNGSIAKSVSKNVLRPVITFKI